MARLIRGDEVVDVWIEDDVRGQQLFLRDAAGVLRRQLTRDDARGVNAHLASNVEFFGPRGWR